MMINLGLLDEESAIEAIEVIAVIAEENGADRAFNSTVFKMRL